MIILNQNKRTAHDERNEEAKKHRGHDLIKLRSHTTRHRTAGEYEIGTFICMDCDVQFKAYIWPES